ncbi:hypothetical protein Rhe02_64690 [Rhizocola hellebori]|uniref:Uncharacterized protein n=1 Tax=Rhizocola hellebori TaxID=1392758 RepID=A0A8J3QE77_9ACTN|nr:hypothetical protein [Rhizocola hellebori]GIH08402.1 hypothetical protein Rhe02_64690 [Rhizocola hellebori]
MLTLCVCGGVFAFLALPFLVVPEGFEDISPVREPATPWQLVASGVSFVVIGVALFATMVLLLVPPSHRWHVSAARRTGQGDGGTVGLR